MYGSDDCRTFLDIPPLVHWEDGSTCLNPDYNAVTKFHRAALAKDPNLPEASLVPVVQIAPGATVEFQLTVEREENGMGHFLINELLLLPTPAGASRLRIEMKTVQGDKTYTNASVFNNAVFGNAHLNVCLPCPIMLWPNQTMIFKVTNNEAVDTLVRIVARGKRFMPYHDPSLVTEMESCWAKNPSIPMWLGMDDTTVAVAANSTARSQITIPGGGWFQIKYIRTRVLPFGTVNPENILLNVTQGRIGRRFMNRSIPLSLYATSDLAVNGFPGDVFRSASANHCPEPEQLVRGNTRIIHDFENTTGTDATVELTYVGCYHFTDMCPPEQDYDRARRRAYMLEDSPLFLDECVPAAEPPQQIAGLGNNAPQGEWEDL